MNANAKLWVAALRSGEYKQARGRLAKPDGSFCCLGVACEVYIKAGNKLGKALLEDCGKPLHFVYDAHYSSTLPTVVKDWLGLKDNCGVFTSPDFNSLVTLNDNEVPFSRIADVIETTPSLFNDPI